MNDNLKSKLLLGLGVTLVGLYHYKQASSQISSKKASSIASTDRARLIICGSVNADIVIDVDRLPLAGETVAASRSDTGNFFPGGKGANTAVSAARLQSPNIDVQFAGMFGQDSYGDSMKTIMTQAGCDLSISGSPENSAIPTGTAYIFLQANGQNSIIIVGGANVNWPHYPAKSPQNSSLNDSKQINNLSPLFQTSLIDKNTKMVMLQREIPDEVNLQIAKLAHSKGIPVFQDLGGKDGPLPAELLPLLYCVSQSLLLLYIYVLCTL